MTTIGYGDYSAKEGWGRFVAVSQGIVGIVIVTMFSGVVINKLQPTEEQKYAFNFIQREKFQKKRFNQALRILQVKFLFKRGKCTRGYMNAVIKDAIKQLRKLRRYISQYSEDTNTEAMDTVVTQNNDMTRQLETLTNVIRMQSEILAELKMANMAEQQTEQSTPSII